MWIGSVLVVFDKKDRVYLYRLYNDYVMLTLFLRWRCEVQRLFQTPSTGLRHSSFDGAGKRFSECAPSLSLAVKFVCDVKVKLKGLVLLTSG